MKKFSLLSLFSMICVTSLPLDVLAMKRERDQSSADDKRFEIRKKIATLQAQKQAQTDPESLMLIDHEIKALQGE